MMLNCFCVSSTLLSTKRHLALFPAGAIRSDLNKVISCLQKIKGKNLGQNHDNLMNFLVKDYECSPEIAENLINKYSEI